MLHVRVLGQFDVRLDETPVEVPSRPAQSLLAYLALNAAVAHRRERLAGLFWPDATEANARAYLRMALWRIRKSFESAGADWQDFLRIDEIAVEFAPSAPWRVDAQAVMEIREPGSWTIDELVAAATPYQGELLPGFYEEWVVLDRERVQAAFEGKMRQLLERLVQSGRWEQVLDWGERWIAFGHVPEPAYRALMIAHAATGDRAGGTAAFHRCEQALERELGVRPSPDLLQLNEDLGRGELPEEALAAAGPEPQIPEQPPAPGPAPFKGLEYFDVEDAGIFFGRELLTARLVEMLAKPPHVVVVVGSSGSGKSSVLRAGLIPALMRGQALATGSLPPPGSSSWLVRVLRPTTHPLETLALRLTQDQGSILDPARLMDDLGRDPRGLHLAARRLTEHARASRLILVVDQFEEVFTLCKEEAERAAFIDNLLDAVSPERDGPITLVLALRADFYAQCAQYPALREALSAHQVYLGPMTAQDLRRAIEEPARQGGWGFEPGLVDLLLRDVRGEPGALPLLSHALLETWHRRSGRVLTLRGYAASGTVRGAIARTAETVLNQRLTDEQRTIARSIFLRLTELGDGTPETRRRAALGEIVPSGVNAARVKAVLDVLAQARLITIDEDNVEVAHEALIREWPTLRAWLDEDREGLRLHRHLTQAAREWEELGQDPGALYRGTRLAHAAAWAEANDALLNGLERSYLAASIAQAQTEEAEREAARQRELEAAHRLAEAETQRAAEHARAARRLRWLASGLTLGFSLAVLAAGFAFQQRRLAERQAVFASARELAAAAESNLGLDSDLSLLLAMEAAETTDAAGLPTLPEVESVLHRALQAARTELVLRGHRQRVNPAVYSPDGTRILTASRDGTARLWDARTGEQLLLIAGDQRGLASAAFSPDGRTLATAGDERTIVLWDASSGARVRTIPAHDARLYDVAFSPDGRRLASASGDQTARIFDAATGARRQTLSGHAAALVRVTWSPDGMRLATSSEDGTARIWDADSGEELQTFTTSGVPIRGVAFSPDGTLLATSDLDGTVVLWELATNEPVLTLAAHGGAVLEVKFSPDGTHLATGSFDRTVKLWDVATGEAVLTLAGHTGAVFGLNFSPDGQHLVSAGDDGVARVWNIGLLEELLTIPVADGAHGLAFSPDGTRIAAGLGEKGEVGIWDSLSGDLVLRTPLGMQGDWVDGVAFSTDGALMATASRDGRARILDAHSGELLQSLAGHDGWVNDVAFSPDGSKLVTAGEDWLAKVWDVRTGGLLLTLAGQPFPLFTGAYSPDGARGATGGLAGTVRIWDATTGDQLLDLVGHEGEVFDLAFNPSGDRLASAGADRTVRVWEVETGQVLLVMGGHSGSVTGVAFSPDGRRLASSSMDGTVRLWDAATGENTLTLNLTGSTWVRGVAFSPDGKKLAVSTDRGIYFYLVKINDLLELAEARVARGISEGECRRYLHLERCPTPPLPQPVVALPPAAAERGRVCQITEGTGRFDEGINYLAYQGLLRASKTYGWESAVFEPMLATDLEVKTREALESRCDLIVATGFWLGDATVPKIPANPDQQFLVLDVAFDPPFENVWAEVYAPDQGAFLAGYVAAAVSRTGVVGTFGGVQIPSVEYFMSGFARGVAYFNDLHGRQVRVVGWDLATNQGMFIGGFCCFEEGRDSTETLLEQGADVVLPVAGALVGEGAAAAVQEYGAAFVIGVDTDWTETFPQYADVVLTSIQKRLDVSVVNAVAAIEAGTFEGGTHVGNLENGAVVLSPFYGREALIPDAVLAELRQIADDIIEGKIHTDR